MALALALAAAGAVGAFGCGGGQRRSASPSLGPAEEEVEVLRAHFGDVLAAGTEPEGDGAPVGPAATARADVAFPPDIRTPFRVEDRRSGASVDVFLRDTQTTRVESADGYAVYRNAAASGATVVKRALPDGVEDFISFRAMPSEPEIAYDFQLPASVAGLRLVANTLEFVDDGGAPRLRVAPPFIVGADGTRIEATLALDGCAADENPAPPWGRRVTPPGDDVCTLRVRWPGEQVEYPALLDPAWTTTGSMATARQGHTATLLSTGKVLAVGGSNGTTALATAELYDPATRTWAATGAMTGARQLHTATQLATSSNATTNGAVLVAGGLNGSTSLNTAQLYSPTKGTWTAATNLNTARHGHTATRLADGRVLVAGGLSGTTTLVSAAIYNPASGTGSWAATTGLIPPPGQRAHTATLLATSNAQLNNKVLLAGGNSGSATLSAVYLFDPTQSAFSTLASMPAAREGHTATVLASGKLLVTGGKNGTTTLATAAVFDPGSGQGSWSTVGNMTTARQGHSATLLPDGRVLVAGGSNGTTTLSSAELFTATANTFAVTATMTAAAQGHTATLLGNGTVLVAGGTRGSATLAEARIYDPSLGNACTSNSQCPSGFCVSGVCCNNACTDQCSTCTLSGFAGVCSPKPNGSSCSDANACTLSDTCQSGTCTSGAPKTCTAVDMCHLAGTCDPTAGTCSSPIGPDKVGCDINLRVDGVVDNGDGTFTAVFGHDSTASTAFHPTTNTVSLNTLPVSNPHPAPPAYLPPGQHPGDFLPTFSAGQSISWTVDGQTVSASQSSTHLTTVTIGTSGSGVNIGGTTVIVKPDVAPYLAPPGDPGQAADPTTGLSAFNGALDGQLTVSPSGAALYKVPIMLPPGIAGMAPNLGLAYSSQGGDGIAGQGWELAGLSMIHRCAITRPQDGFAIPVEMKGPAPGDDGICLDGKRLFDRGPNVDDSERYEPELADFSDITSTADPMSPDGSTFKVVTKNGETRYYGMDDSTRVRLPGFFIHQPPTADGRTVAIWLLQKVVDVWGNEYEVFYNDDKSDFDTRGILMSQIKYTGRLAGSAVADDAAPVPEFQIVKFGYESRPDVRHTRFRSAVLPRPERLKSIDTGIGLYTLDYVQKSNPPTVDDRMLPSRLQAVNYCPANGSCAQPLTFDWDAGGYDWQEMPSWKLPVDIGSNSHAQFMDLDGDGRLDIIQFFGSADQEANTNITSKAWQNTGAGFQPAPQLWTLPGDLAAIPNDASANNTAYGDLDGDGVIDAVHIAVAPSHPACPGTIASCVLQWVGLGFNRIRTDGNWLRKGTQIPSSADWANFLQFGPNGALVDINGDGRADLVSMAGGSNEPMRVLINSGVESGGNLVWQDAGGLYGGVTPISEFELRDVNRDGLPDLIGKFGTSSAGKSYLNTGSPISGQTTNWFRFDEDTIPGNLPKNLQSTADFDGDGFYDYLQFGCRNPLPQCGGGAAQSIPFVEQFGLSTGLGYDVPPNSDPRAAAIHAFTPSPDDRTINLDDYAFIPVDLNADGLADLVQHRPQPGQIDGGGFPIPLPENAIGRLLFNDGSIFRDLSGFTNFGDDPPVAQRPTPVPRVPRQNRQGGDPHSTFFDLDGDGVTDLVSTTTAWRNTFRPPVIKGFPNGIANKTVATYLVTTTTAAQGSFRPGNHPTYANTSTSLAPGTALLNTPLRVVSSLASDDGIGGTSVTDYEYRDLRVSPSGRGPQGFATTIVTGPEDKSQPANQHTRVMTTAQYLQPFPYTGLPSKVTRDLVDATTGNKFASIAVVTTDYCDTTSGSCTPPTGADPGANGSQITRFVRPTTVVDRTYLLSSTSLANRQDGSLTSQRLEITSTFQYDKEGNPTQTKVTNQQGVDIYQKTIVNVYGDPDSAEERLGKVTLSTTTTQKVQPLDCLATPITHTTQYQYGEVNRFQSPTDGSMVSTLGVKTKIIEPGAGAPTELHTAYEYDRFGNVVKTTACATAFDACGQAGQTGPSDLPYRITQVSYDPASFAIPAGGGRLSALPYGAGRYPVKSTNAAGQVEMSAYDVRFGKLLQHTDANGVGSCREYDGIGRQTSEIGRCGSSGELITTMQRFLTNSSLRPKVVTATAPPAGTASWNYADALGRTVMTIGRAFDAEYTKTLAFYDNLGRISATTMPFFSTAADFNLLPNVRQTSTHYDPIGRPTSVSDDLGVLDGTATTAPGNTPRSTTVTTSYENATITTTRTVNGETRTRSESKNVLGKLASVTDTNGVALSFTYDADGDMTDTASPTDVCNPPANAGTKVLHVTYDARGRKQTSHDPDLGDSTYQYNGFGDVVVQTDGKGRPTTMTYDKLARVVQRDDDSGTASWVYDAAPHGIGKVAAMVSPGDTRLAGTCQLEFAPAPSPGAQQAGRSYHYTPFGELEEVTDCADGSTFVTTYGYDDAGRPDLVRYPAVKGDRFAVSYAYTESGYLQYVADAADGGVIWKAKALDAAGHVIDEQLRNGVETVSVRNDATGWLLGRTSTAHADGETAIQQWAYAFDEIGNLRARQRTDEVIGADSTETFGYDPLDRLTSSEVQIPAQGSTPAYDALESYTFDALGNIQTKAGKTYKYQTGCLAGGRAAGPHALCQIDNGPAYNYDGNGNLVSVSDRVVTWNAGNKVTRLKTGTESAAQTTDLMYGADGLRVVEAAGIGDAPLGSTGNTSQSRTVYVGLGASGKSVYERTTRGQTIEHSLFIYAASAHDGSAFALRVVTEDASAPSAPPTIDYQYRHLDHLGSVTAVSDSRGHVADADWAGPAATIFSYDPWGARRSPDGRSADPSAFSSPPGNRGFTDQETIPAQGLVNMNGRVYDPIVGRFLSPDPNIQLPSDLQSYNRYSYGGDNPLRYNDPTGYFLAPGFDTFVNIFVGVVAIAACAGTDGAGCGLAFSLALAAYNTSSAIASGTPWDQALATNLVSFGAGFVFGSLGGTIGSAIAGGPGGAQALGAIIGGAIGGGATAAFMTPLTGGSLGENILVGALQGAFAAAASVAFQQTAQLSQADLGKYLEPDPERGGDWARLSADGRVALKPTFDKLGYDVDRARFHVGYSLQNIGGINRTFGDNVYLVGSSWKSLTPDEQLFLLGHELTHSVQWQGGTVKFAALYMREEVAFDDAQQYGVSPSLAKTSIGNLDNSLLWSNRAYTLDEIADRVGLEVSPGYGVAHPGATFEAQSAYGY